MSETTATTEVGGGVIAVEKFLAEIEAGAPCGPNLEYDADFQAMELAARGKPQQELGEGRIEAVPPAWVEVRRLATHLLSRSKDIRPALYLARAELAEDGLAGYARGIDLVRAMLDRCWDTVHPQLDADDGDPTARLNAVVGLVDADTALREIRQAVIAEDARRGRVIVRDVLLTLGKLQPTAGETPRPFAEIEEILQSAAAEGSERLSGPRAALQSAQALHELLAQKVGAERTVDIKPLRALLQPVADVCAQVLGGAVTGTEGSADARPAAVAAVIGEIRSRDDAVRALERVCEFIERTEPANPAPLLIRRAQRLMRKTFVEIIEDLTPESLGAIKSLAGLKDD